MPRPFVARLSTVAPDASPKSTHVPRSVQSTIELIFSAATTSTVSAVPAWINPSPSVSP